ncbi:DNA ligase [Streptomyces microflavus]
MKPMLAKSVAKIPPRTCTTRRSGSGSGRSVFRDGAEVELGSRTGKTLTRYFPELVEALRDRLTERCVMDGEIVIAREGHLDFDALSERDRPGGLPGADAGRATPASFVAFDLLALQDESLLDVPLAERRKLLTTALSGVTAPVHLAPATTDIGVAQRWFEEYEGAGLDGVSAKPLTGRYLQDERAMFKVKHERTADVVVAGYRLHKSGPVVGSLLLGLHDDRGTLQHVGVSAAFPMKRRAELIDEQGAAADGGRERAPVGGLGGGGGPRERPGCPGRRPLVGQKDLSWVPPAGAGWRRWRTTTWRTAYGSATPPASAAGARTGMRKNLHVRAASEVLADPAPLERRDVRVAGEVSAVRDEIAGRRIALAVPLQDLLEGPFGAAVGAHVQGYAVHLHVVQAHGELGGDRRFLGVGRGVGDRVGLDDGRGPHLFQHHRGGGRHEPVAEEGRLRRRELPFPLVLELHLGSDVDGRGAGVVDVPLVQDHLHERGPERCCPSSFTALAYPAAYVSAVVITHSGGIWIGQLGVLVARAPSRASVRSSIFRWSGSSARGRPVGLRGRLRGTFTGGGVAR